MFWKSFINWFLKIWYFYQKYMNGTNIEALCIMIIIIIIIN